MVALIPQPRPTIEWARRYIRAGFSLIPIRADGSKAPALRAGQVEQYRERKPTEEEIQNWFAPNKAVGIGLVCGLASGNLAVLDFESDAAWQTWLGSVSSTESQEYLKGCPISRTPKGGRHVYCRLAETWVAGGVLARMSPKVLLCEVRGQGHYVLSPGSPLACHSLNKPYLFESEGWLANVAWSDS